MITLRNTLAAVAGIWLLPAVVTAQAADRAPASADDAQQVAGCPRHELLCDTSERTEVEAAAAKAPGGFLESDDSVSTRAVWTASQIQAFLPARGKFTFPAPYNTEGIRITTAGDCGGTDCVQSVGDSSWRNINNHLGRDSMLIFLGLRGIGPSLFSYTKSTEQVRNLGPLFDAASPLARHTGEGWYFSATRPTTLYVVGALSPKLLRYDVLTRTFGDTVFDATTQFGEGKYISQTHSSDDDNVHSATLRDLSSDAKLGCLAYREDARQFFYYAALDDFGECQIDKSGRWLLIKEDLDGVPGRDNLIVDLESGAERVLPGEEDEGRGSVGYISHSNAQPGVPLSQQYACAANATTAVVPRANEIVCFRLDGSPDVLVVTQNMTELAARRGGDRLTTTLPMGNLDVTGRYFIWVSNMGGSRADAFMVKVPAQLLTGARPGATTDPNAEVAPGSSLMDSTTSLRTADGASLGDPMSLAEVTAADASLIAYLKLDEGTGTAAADSSGNGNAGTLMSGATWTTGSSGGGVALDGVDDYVRIPHVAALDAYPLTVAVWFKTTTTTGARGLVNKYLGSSLNGYQLFLSNGSLCAWYFKDSTNNVYDNTGCTLNTPGSNDGQWHHAVFVVDALGGRLYVDGAQKTSRAWTGVAGPTTTAQEIRLGHYPNGSYLPATADELRIYNRALSATEITQLYTSTRPAGDTTPPQLSGVGVAGVGATSATAAWTTDEPADTQVEYGTSTAYGSSTALNTSLAVSHSQALSGLSPVTLYHYRVKSRDAAGNLATSADFTFTTLDGTPPSVSITTPAGGATVSGTLPVSANASDTVGVVGVQFKLDGANLGVEDTASPYSVSWNTTTAANGSHILTATARDGAGNATTSASVNVTVSNGTVMTLEPQDTFIELDAANQSTSPQLLTYTWPDNQVANAILMKFDLSAIPPGAVVADATLQLALVGSDLTPETTYTITAHKMVGKNPVITGATGYTADGVAPWTPNACCSGGVPLAQADISAAYDTRAIDKTLGYKSWSITAMAQEWVDNATTNFGLLLNSDATRLKDHYRTFASMENADPILRPYLRVTYSLVPDVTPPAVSITAPAGGATVSGTLPVSANASDNVGVVGVQFKLDGANLSAEDTTSPYSVSWNTTTAANGGHTLTAVARDAAGNVTTSAGVAVTVTNDATPPSVSITAPAGGATVSGTLPVSSNASDNVGVVGVQFKLDGANQGAEDMASPYSVSWNTTGAANGSHTLTAVARDAAGNVTTSASVSVTVANGVVVMLAPQDTFIKLDATNQSTNPQLSTYTWPDNQVANAILMKFDLSAISPGAVVSDATLQLALVNSDLMPETTYTITAHKVAGKNPVITGATGFTADGVAPWTPNACCSGGVPLAQADISAPYDTRAIDKTPGYKSWSITAMAQEWVANPTTNFGLLLNSDATRLKDRYRTFASMENADPSLRPYLRITYSLVPDVTPPVISAVLSSAVTASGAVIGWTTNEPSDSQVEYGTTTAYGSLSTLNASRVVAHVATLNGLAANRLYHFRVRSRDFAGNLAVSGDSTFTTLALDVTPPTVSITAPAAGATVVGTVPVTASASDNVAVVGVQFKLDGAALGAEDTSSPYSIAWNTTTSVNGAHALTALARDAAGNQTTSAAVSATVANTVPGGVIFESNWDTATGNSNNAITDGARWPGYTQFDSPPTPIMSVVTGGPNGHNALRVQQRGPLYPAQIWKTNFIAQSSDYYLRYYFKTDDTSSAGDHIVAVGPGIAVPPGDNLTFLRKYGGATNWSMTLSAYGCGDPLGYPMRHWAPGPRLANGQWYRLEYFVDFVNTTHMQVHPRIYDAAGTLLYDDNDFQQENFGASTPWNGRNDWTLASFYAAGFNFCVDPVVMNDFGMGNNGQAGASDTGRYWYFAGVQLRANGWPGPLTGTSPDVTPPTVSISTPASGATVSGSATTVSATASDNVGVAGVQFKLDGANLRAEVAAPPYSVSWNTTGAVNGSHTLTAVARDAAGNQTASAGVTVIVSNAAPVGIAALYPGDVGIEGHPDVVVVEKFEEATLTSLFSGWTDVLNGVAMSFSSDVPVGSAGTRSLNIPWVGGGVNNGGHLYKQLSTGVNDTLYVRYYIKYPTTGKYRHDGIWMGGYNPPLSWPNPQAGIKPVGNDRFAAAAEQTDDTTHFDHYDYWMDLHQSADGFYWGNTLLNNPSVQVNVGQWTCIEQMVKLNNPVTASNGEHAIWIDGVKVSHLGQGFPNGSWAGGNFTQNPAGSPFDGFRWRSDANLNLNWVWLQVYAPDAPAGFSSSIKFDHMVVAKSYIGCLASGASDTTPPVVSISAPTAGATVSGPTVVSASASDNVGVIGVQFKMDGADLGAEDTTSPYSTSWSTTTVSDGVHVLTAVARDAAGNRTTSTAVSVTVRNLLPGGVLFESNWDTAAGTSFTAVTDGARWPDYWEFNGGAAVQLLSVVPGGPNGHNALRVQQRGSSFAANLQLDNFAPPSTDFYVRYYMKNDDTSTSGDHTATAEIYHYENLTYMRKYSGAADWRMVVSMFGCGYVYPISHWSPALKLTSGQWYRFEYYVHYVSPNRIQVHPRVYDALGNPIFSDADFQQSDYASALWNGRNTWTLASYYAAGFDFCVDPTFVNEFGLGNNGQQFATDTGRYWYYAALQIRSDTWAGPVSTALAAVSVPQIGNPGLYSGGTVIEARPAATSADESMVAENIPIGWRRREPWQTSL